MEPSIRRYESRDARVLTSIFYDSVRTIGLLDYSKTQVEAWVPEIPDQARFDARARDGRLVLVVVNDIDEPVAYGDLEPSGHIDHLYCHPELVGRGLASALYERLEKEARRSATKRLFVEASEAARRLFLKKGFIELERRDFLLRGVMIHNYLMEKLFSF